MKKILESAKAVASLVGAIVTALLATQAPDSSTFTTLTVIAAVASAIVTWVVPNAEAQ